MKQKLKTIGNIVWKSCTMMASVALIVFCVMLTYAFWQETHRYSSYDRTPRTEPISANIQIVHGRKDKVVNIHTGKTIFKADKVMFNPFLYANDSLIPFKQNGLGGFFDRNTGLIVIPPTYRQVYKFSEGLASVSNEQGLYGFINTQGELVIPFTFHYSEEGYIFKDGVCIVKDETAQKWCVINHAGEYVIEPLYEQIERRKGYLICGNEGELKHKYTLSGELVDNAVIDEITPLEGTTLIQYKSWKKYGLMDSKGHILTPAIYTDIQSTPVGTIIAQTSAGSEMFDKNGKKMKIQTN